MARADRPVLLVGSVGGENAEEVLRMLGAEVGDLAMGLTDGETGPRKFWVMYLWEKLLQNHPDIVFHPTSNAGYGELPKFSVAEGVETVRFEELGYVGFATESYATFKRLRSEGVIPAGTRFQVCIPFPEDAMRLPASTERDFRILQAAYSDAVKREVAKIAAAIPAEELVIQWDVNWELIAIETDDGGKEEPLAFRLDGRPLERFAGYLKDLSSAVPAAAKMGIHLCYGDFGHQHFIQPKNLEVCVLMAKRALESTAHPVDFFHMPVPRDRSDDAYFAPLDGLDLGTARLYIGLVHFTDGLEGSLKRLEVFRRHYTGPTGVATECGMGRRPLDQDMQKLLHIHRELAERI